MIIGHEVKPTSSTELIQQNMDEARHLVFHLTGSRYFGHHRPDSDWDYFCKFTYEAQEWLGRQHFEQISVSTYADANTRAVFDHANARIQVQLVDDVDKKIHIQNILGGLSLNWSAMTKQEQRKIWNLAYAVYDTAPPPPPTPRRKIPEFLGRANPTTDLWENKVAAIKFVREVTGFGLKDTKDLVENLEQFMAHRVFGAL